VRWWMHFDPPYIMSVDNASVKGMDFSTLLATDPDLWMVQWQDGKGEIERQDVDADENLNGLREQFIDVVPYAPTFQQFLMRMQAKALLLPQAKKVDVDLIRQIFESKRQLPFHYPVAAGNYWWDAADETLFASTAAQLQNAIASINGLVAAVNSLVTSVNAKDQAIVDQVNSNVVAKGDALTTAHDAFLNAVTSGIYEPLYYFVAHVNGLIGDHYDYDNPGMNTLNNKLNEIRFTGLNAPPGGVLPQFNNTVTGPGTNYGPDFVNVAHSDIAWTPLPNVATTNAQWIPIGGTAPVSVTPAEQAAIMNGIAARTNALNVKKNIKIAEVNALTTVAAVIAYDVTTGW
jgi:hypothetical protein